MRLRPATAADVPAVTALEHELFGADAWSAAAVASELGGRRRVSVVAVDGEVVVGYAVLLLGPDVADLQRIAVAPALRRTGLARRLLAAVVAGTERVLLEVSAGNAAARAFYAAAGFAEIDRRPRYYRDGSDALVLAADTRRLTGRSDG